MEGVARVIRSDLWHPNISYLSTLKFASQNPSRGLDSKGQHWAKPAVPLHLLLVPQYIVRLDGTVKPDKALSDLLPTFRPNGSPG